ncbi:MAG TPA: hypothetical protein VMW43_03710 [Bacteroidota bacterium]|nr:hypothetical protein [Bacteroidota bacterium]
MAFNGNEGKVISPATAKKFIGKYQKSSHFRRMKKIRGGFFGKKKLLKILNQKDCVGIRYFHAHNKVGRHTLVLVGEHKAGKPITRMYLDDGPLCPPYCN